MSAGRSLDDYVDVATRLARFAEKYPEGSLAAEIVEDDGKRVLVRAEATRPIFNAEGNIVAFQRGVGHAEEIRNQGMVNKTSAIENAETSAWGRALAALGFETKKGIASKEEMLKVERMTSAGAAGVTKIVEPKRLTPAQVVQVESRLKDADPKKVQLALAALGATDLPELNAKQAKELIAQVAA